MGFPLAGTKNTLFWSLALITPVPVVRDGRPQVVCIRLDQRLVHAALGPGDVPVRDLREQTGRSDWVVGLLSAYA